MTNRGGPTEECREQGSCSRLGSRGPATKGRCLEDIVNLGLEAQLCLNFLTYKVEIIIVPTSEGRCEWWVS